MASGRLAGLAGLAAGLALLAGCVQVIPGQKPRTEPAPKPPVPATALLLGARPGPSVASLHLDAADAGPALASFLESCPALLRRADASGLTQTEDWRPVCAAAASWPYGNAVRFFETRFETARIGSGDAFATGYYEPEIAGVRSGPRPGYEVPVYGLPPDLVRAWPETTAPDQRKGQPPLGRRDANGAVTPYHDRAQIEDGALAGRGLEVAWAADPVELFFLQVQGSGRLIGPDGQVVRIGYAGQNGRAYTSIGSLMRQRGLIGTGPGQYPGSMQGIMQYLREHPAEGRALMRENQSWVFFRELTGDGPLGALGVPVRRGSSVAADPAYVPLGAPVILQADRPLANGLWIAQDTGGAIKGPNRFDTFWGAGQDARTIAGEMTARGTALLLLPRGTLARLHAR